jgi:hypothetical protein
MQLHGLALGRVHKGPTARGFKDAAGFLVSLEPKRVTAAEIGQQRNVESFGADAEAAEHPARRAGTDAAKKLAAIVGK